MSTSRDRLYFDNAATTFPKPPAVPRAVLDYFTHVHASAGRGAYREALASGRILDRCRAAVACLLNCPAPQNVIFTLNGTDALHLAIRGVLRPADHVVTTCMDHNSVLRPLAALADQIGLTWTAVAADPHTTRVAPADLAAALTPQTRLVIINHASNVTGVLQPLADLVALCRAHGVPVLVDAAQTAGHVPIDFAGLGIDLLACPGHKGLLGPLGTGVLLIRPGFEPRLQTVREGGTGSHSEHSVQPADAPDRFEAGSHNAPGLAGLLAGVEWLLERSVESIRAHETQLCTQFTQRLDDLPALTWYGPRDPAHRVGVFSVRLDPLDPAELAALLEHRAGILTRAGLHCAPLAHRTIGTLATGGTTRFSFGPFLSDSDVTVAADALADLAAVTPARHDRCATAL